MLEPPSRALQPRQKATRLETTEAQRRAASASASTTSTLHCPHCHVAKISLFKKLLFGPVFRFRCTHCAGYWRVSWWSLVVAILTISSFTVLLFLTWITGLLRTIGPGAGLIAGLAFIVAGLAIARLLPIRKASRSLFSFFS